MSQTHTKMKLENWKINYLDFSFQISRIYIRELGIFHLRLNVLNYRDNIQFFYYYIACWDLIFYDIILI